MLSAKRNPWCDTGYSNPLAFLFSSLFKLWNLCSRCYYLFNSQELWSWPSPLCSALQYFSSWKDVFISHYSHDTLISCMQLKIRELLYSSISSVSNCAYHTNGNECRYPIFSSLVQTHLCNLSALSAEEKPKNTKAGMLQVTAEAVGEWMSFLLALWSDSPRTHAHAHTHTLFFFNWVKVNSSHWEMNLLGLRCL